MVVLSLVIAVISLVLSFSALFFSRFRPFAPKIFNDQVSFGYVDWKTQKGLQRFIAVIMPCEIHNLGAQPGTIKDITFSLSSESLGGEIYFFPLQFIDPNYVGKNGISIVIDRPWDFITVPPHNFIRQTIFLVNDHSFPGQPTKLTKGQHNYSIKYRKSGDKKWTTACEGKVTLTELSLQQLATVGNFHQPDMGTSELRDKLVNPAETTATPSD